MISVGHARHLVARFVQSVRGRTPDPADLRWVATELSAPEWTLFQSMTPTDQAHAIDVGRRVEVAWPSSAVGEGVEASQWVIVAALLHDIGKIESAASVTVRVVATIVSPIVSDAGAIRLASRRGPVGAVGRHLRYPEIGASLLGTIGSHEFVRSWAAEHHSRPEEWSVPAPIGHILRSADDAAS